MRWGDRDAVRDGGDRHGGRWDGDRYRGDREGDEPTQKGRRTESQQERLREKNRKRTEIRREKAEKRQRESEETTEGDREKKSSSADCPEPSDASINDFVGSNKRSRRGKRECGICRCAQGGLEGWSRDSFLTSGWSLLWKE